MKCNNGYNELPEQFGRGSGQGVVLAAREESAAVMRCFPGATTIEPQAGWLEAWLQQTAEDDWALPARAQDALAELVPLLLCGEQSAQFVFRRQAADLRASAQVELASVLSVIEREEEMHERALHYLAGRLPVPGDLHQRKRRAQRFYASLSHGVGLAEHFARIEALDSCVSQIMYGLTRARWGRQHPLAVLFGAIKVDEARHVGVSRRYANALGLTSAERARQGTLIGQRIVAFLMPDATALECLGVDPDTLFGRLQSSGQR